METLAKIITWLTGCWSGLPDPPHHHPSLPLQQMFLQQGQHKEIHSSIQSSPGRHLNYTGEAEGGDLNTQFDAALLAPEVVLRGRSAERCTVWHAERPPVDWERAAAFALTQQCPAAWMDQDQDRDESHTMGDKGVGSGRVGGRGKKRAEVDRRASVTQKSIICSTANKPASVCARRRSNLGVDERVGGDEVRLHQPYLACCISWPHWNNHTEITK